MGLTGEALDLSSYAAVVIVGVQHRGDGIPLRDSAIVADDILIVRGTLGVVDRMRADRYLEFISELGRPGEAEGGRA